MFPPKQCVTTVRVKKAPTILIQWELIMIVFAAVFVLAYGLIIAAGIAACLAADAEEAIDDLDVSTELPAQGAGA